MASTFSFFLALLLLLQGKHAQAFIQSPSSSSSTSCRSRVLTSTTPTGVDVVLPTGASLDDEEKEDGSFDWFKVWYPIAPVDMLDKERPHKFQLLGEDIVVWNDGSVGEFGPKKKKQTEREGTWRAFVDSCPHRKVPLSEGRVENDGTLLCSYHAWRFDGDGKCVEVPQALSQMEKECIINSPRANCNAYPSKVINGILFIWPSSDENAVLESELTPVVHRPSHEDKDRLFEGTWSYRELPYGYDYFIENVVDPAHASVSHHKLVGNRYDNQQIIMETISPLDKDGFTISQETPFGNLIPANTTFYAPSVVTLDNSYGDGSRQSLELYASPSRPGFSNYIGRVVILKDDQGNMPKMLRAFTLPLPKWVNHLLRNAFLNQDALFLHHQERSMNQRGNYETYTEKAYNYNKAVFATRTDKGVIHFRDWIQKFAGGRIPYRNNPTMPPASNEVVFDVWNAHTKYCKYCQDALRRLKRARFATLFASACFAIIRPFSNVVANLASTLAIAGVGLALDKLIGLFYRYEFSHANND